MESRGQASPCTSYMIGEKWCLYKEVEFISLL